MTHPDLIDDTPTNLGRCVHCDWQVMFPSAVKTRAGEQRHLELRHADAPPATDELCDRLVYEHASEAEVVVLAIETAARMNHGLVDANSARALIPPGITPQLPGAMFNVMRRRGRLVPVAQTVNTDAKGRNQGKPLTQYRLVEHVSAVRA